MLNKHQNVLLKPYVGKSSQRLYKINIAAKCYMKYLSYKRDNTITQTTTTANGYK